MRCKQHFTDISSSVGVCASCLRDRLLALMAAQAQALAIARAQKLNRDQEDHRKPDTRPPPLPPPLPLVLPRSVSPYITRRKSDTSARNRHNLLSDQLFYSTPQVGPTGVTVRENPYKEQRSNKSSLLSRFFRSKSSTRNSRTSSSSSSWFPNLLSGHRKKRESVFSLETAAGDGRKTERNRDRGMSPARVSDCGGEEEECRDGSSGYSSEAPESWRQTPQRAAPPVRRGGGGKPSHSRNVSGLNFCLSPLVRPSPNRHWNQKGVTPEISLHGEVRVPVKPSLSTASALAANRSRKLADFGRFNQNH